LNSIELKIDKLDEYKNTPEISKDLKKSIDTAIEFWKLVNEGKNQMREFSELLKNKVKNDNNLKNSKLKYFLDKICADSDGFNKFKDMEGKKLKKTVKQLTTEFDNAESK
jgi:hypothetical protein